MILAALRHIQEDIKFCDGQLIHDHLRDIATDGGKHELLTLEEIDGLCERLNMQEPAEALPSAEDVKNDPATSRWLSAGLATALSRDPVDAVNDAELLRKLLQATLGQPSWRGKAMSAQHTPDELVAALKACEACLSNLWERQQWDKRCEEDDMYDEAVDACNQARAALATVKGGA